MQEKFKLIQPSLITDIAQENYNFPNFFGSIQSGCKVYANLGYFPTVLAEYQNSKMKSQISKIKRNHKGTHALKLRKANKMSISTKYTVNYSKIYKHNFLTE